MSKEMDELADADAAVVDRQRCAFFVNGTKYFSEDPVVDGRAILRLAGSAPPSEHVLIELTRPGSRTIGLDESIDLRADGRERFRAFLSDRSFNFTVDEVGYEWGASTISEIELRDVAGVAEGKLLVLERKDAPDEVLEAGATVDLASRGTEHLRSRQRLIIVTYGPDEKEFTLEPRDYKGAELASIFGVPPGHVLDLVPPDAPFKEIGPNDTVHVKTGMHFLSHPPKGSSS